MSSLRTPKHDISSWIGYPLVCLLLAGVLWRTENVVKKDNPVPPGHTTAPGAQTKEFVSTWEEVVTAIPAVIRQLL